MNIFQAIVLGIVEGLTEFLPVSSTGHLTITEKLLGLQVDDRGVTAFTAIIQFGAIVATFVYFWRDIVAIVRGFIGGLASEEGRQDPYWRLSLAVIVGSTPIAVVGLLASDLITGPLRSLWVVAAALILWSGVMVAAEIYHSRLLRQPAPSKATAEGTYVSRVRKKDTDVTVIDALIIGTTQCLALMPGVSRSGATISAGLFRGLDRVVATRLSFFLAIPALTAAGILEAVQARDDVSSSVGWIPTLVGMAVSFVVAYASIAWLLALVARHSITVFVWYRVLLGVVLLGLLSTGLLTAT